MAFDSITHLDSLITEQIVIRHCILILIMDEKAMALLAFRWAW